MGQSASASATNDATSPSQADSANQSTRRHQRALSSFSIRYSNSRSAPATVPAQAVPNRRWSFIPGLTRRSSVTGAAEGDVELQAFHEPNTRSLRERLETNTRIARFNYLMSLPPRTTLPRQRTVSAFRSQVPDWPYDSPRVPGDVLSPLRQMSWGVPAGQSSSHAPPSSLRRSTSLRQRFAGLDNLDPSSFTSPRARYDYLNQHIIREVDAALYQEDQATDPYARGPAPGLIANLDPNQFVEAEHTGQVTPDRHFRLARLRGSSSGPFDYIRVVPVYPATSSSVSRLAGERSSSSIPTIPHQHHLFDGGEHLTSQSIHGNIIPSDEDIHPGSRFASSRPRGRYRQQIRRADNAPLTRILQLAARSVANQLSGNTDESANLESVGDVELDANLRAFVEELNNFLGAPDSHTNVNMPPLNFWRVFRFDSSSERSLQSPLTNDDPGTVTVVVVGVRALPTTNINLEHEILADMGHIISSLRPLHSRQSGDGHRNAQANPTNSEATVTSISDHNNSLAHNPEDSRDARNPRNIADEIDFGPDPAEPLGHAATEPNTRDLRSLRDSIRARTSGITGSRVVTTNPISLTSWMRRANARVATAIARVRPGNRRAEYYDDVEASETQFSSSETTTIRASDPPVIISQAFNPQTPDIQATQIQASEIQATQIQASEIQASIVQNSTIHSPVIQSPGGQISESQASENQTSIIRRINDQAITIHASESQASNDQGPQSQVPDIQASEDQRFTNQGTTNQAPIIQVSEFHATTILDSQNQASEAQTSISQDSYDQLSITQASEIQAIIIPGSILQASEGQARDIQLVEIHAPITQEPVIQASVPQTPLSQALNFQASDTQASNISVSDYDTSDSQVFNTQASHLQSVNIHGARAQQTTAETSNHLESESSSSSGQLPRTASNAQRRNLHRNDTRRHGFIGGPNGSDPTQPGRAWLVYVIATDHRSTSSVLDLPGLHDMNVSDENVRPTLVDVLSHLYADGTLRLDNYEEMVELAEQLGPATVIAATQEELRTAPGHFTIVRKQNGDLIAEELITGENMEIPEDAECIICQEGYDVSQEVRRLVHCPHVFHRQCVDIWLHRAVNTCPLCRRPAVERRGPEPDGGSNEDGRAN